MANNMNRNKLWSDSLTKNYLKTYVEGLAYDNFDKRMLYNIWRNDENTWWVLNKVQGQWSVCLMILVDYYTIE